ncbi:MULTISPECIES: nuclear transport factor 2 family protein [unclassified Streptomyces]|uniref:YybH family protein n=1 Tax=unclassified Streptomyces TaxID=2593676 RepID=UPI002253BEFA|nr:MULTISPECIES: nuclear transport factor 2 family protein [unclassified Streptomyces]MCX5144182.1 nuclear transport factor 2 family protein [Streptomyces sp. NBC_00338]WSU62516.1 nuclear transport factor 2 family protein [Streptomyces sp. NBC_01104]
MSTPVRDTEQVGAAADALVAAFAEGRLDDYFGAFAPDATFVFHSTPQRLSSTAEYRALWQEWIDQDDFRVLGCTSTGQLIQHFGSTAVFTHDVETTVSTSAGQETVHERETIVFARAADGSWPAVHEHLSARTAG